jgi:hypothetical protein
MGAEDAAAPRPSSPHLSRLQNYDVAIGHVADDASQQLVCVIYVLLMEARIS